ncbi:MAG: PIN domain-containing protein [Limimaricola sp.]|uniref:RSP_2648 family PIN domain-containing protein n=1 Tax=Limimaricola sp. TaxID=2211665 RepID=UPI001DFB1CDA|nr:PIN domain-containing protein [Limimaricola sp.]MBI1418339.1 PIN domain-containing protein [Limimaricola sp.]
MTGPRVVIDACVLYPTVMREMVLGAAGAGLFRARWSARLLEEWARAAARHGPAQEAQARGEIALVRSRFPDAEIPVPEGLARRLWLPDPADIHVLAAAIAGSADLILTLNAKDFPRQVLAEEGVARDDPDHFLLELCEANPDEMQAVAEAVLAEAQRLSDPNWTLRALLKKARLPRLAKRLG